MQISDRSRGRLSQSYGKILRTLNIIDEFSRECLAIKVDRKLNSTNVIDALPDLFIPRGASALTRSNNGTEFIAQAVRDCIAAVGTKTAYIEPGSPLGEWIMQELHKQVRRRNARRKDLLQSTGSANHHRRMEETLQHEETTQCIGLPTTSA